MYHVSILIFCSLFSQVTEGGMPKPTRDREIETRVPHGAAPVTPASPMVTTDQAASVQPAADPKLYRNTMCRLTLPRYSHITLSATERAVLMSLSTEKRDHDGNILQDAEGNILKIPVREGMKVFKGQVLCEFDDRELVAMLNISKAQLELAKAEQKKQIEADYAAMAVQMAMIELKIMQWSNDNVEKSFSALEVIRGEFAIKQAKANLELQEYNLKEVKTRETIVREHELERIEVQIAMRKLVSTIDGMITKISAAEGEWLREGDIVLEIAQFNTIWVLAQPNLRIYDYNDFLGKQATVHVPLPNGRKETFKGSVVFCQPNIAPGETFDVYVEIENKPVGNFWMLQPGLAGVEVEILL